MYTNYWQNARVELKEIKRTKKGIRLLGGVHDMVERLTKNKNAPANPMCEDHNQFPRG